VSEAGQPATASWRRNLAALWFAQFTAIFGFAFAFPFLPLYLHALGIRQTGALAFWTGLAGGASGLALALMSPVWGLLADRYGRKSMLVRAMLGGALTVGLMGFARGPIDLVVLRFLQGASAGTVAAATALVASGTPRQRVGWALGVLTSAIALGSALGPLLGGLAASAVGVRAVFWAGGALLGVATLPVIALVHEAPRTVRSGANSGLRALRAAAPGTVGAVGVLLICQALLQTSYVGFQPLVVLRLLERLSSGSTSVTGLAFGISGLASALAAVTYAGVARRYGYRRVAALTAVSMAAAEVVAGYGPGVVVIVVGAGLAGAFYGAVGPAVSAMLGLETPAEVQGSVFGFSSSATAIGFGLGPLGGGLLASQAGVSAAIGACAVVAVILALVLTLKTREPRR
jgi:DHA1 family multidrug resistance protein-like MFS transporter